MIFLRVGAKFYTMLALGQVAKEGEHMPRREKPVQPRKYEPSREGRVRWRPNKGQKHSLDPLVPQALELREMVPERLQELLQTIVQVQNRLTILSEIESLDDPSAPFSQADTVAQQAIWDRFKSRKHHEHLQAAFARLRRLRLLSRLEAAQDLLNLAVDLLTEEETLIQEFLASVDEALIQKAANILSIPSNLPESGQADIEEHVDWRIQGAKGSIEQFVGSATSTRDRLRAFDECARHIRETLSKGSGWFEVYFTYKKRPKPEVKDYFSAFVLEQQEGIPIPREVLEAVHPVVRARWDEVVLYMRDGKLPAKDLAILALDRIPFGPYARYRWREGKGPIYMISLGPLDIEPDTFEPKF